MAVTTACLRAADQSEGIPGVVVVRGFLRAFPVKLVRLSKSNRVSSIVRNTWVRSEAALPKCKVKKDRPW